MNFYDTSVLVPAVRVIDPRHKRSAALINAADPTTDATAAHALTELYSSLTRFPGAERVPPEPAQAFVAQMNTKLLVVSLTALETLAVIRDVADAALPGTIVYDAIILACARKAGATTIYTHNIKHFHRIAPDLASIMREA